MQNIKIVNKNQNCNGCDTAKLTIKISNNTGKKITKKEVKIMQIVFAQRYNKCGTLTAKEIITNQDIRDNIGRGIYKKISYISVNLKTTAQ